MREVLMCACGRFEEAGSDTRLCGLVVVCCRRMADHRSSESRPSPPPPPPAFFFLALAHVLWGLLRIGQGHVAFIASKRCISWGLLRPPLAPLPHTCLALGLRLAGAAGMREGGSGVPVASNPSLPDNVQNSSTSRILRKPPSLRASGFDLW